MFNWFKKSQVKVKRKVPTMKEDNHRRVEMGYPYLLEVVKERCPKCNGKMWHDQFQKCINIKTGHISACYQCVDCKYRVLFNLITKTFDKKPFGNVEK